MEKIAILKTLWILENWDKEKLNHSLSKVSFGVNVYIPNCFKETKDAPPYYCKICFEEIKSDSGTDKYYRCHNYEIEIEVSYAERSDDTHYLCCGDVSGISGY